MIPAIRIKGIIPFADNDMITKELSEPYKDQIALCNIGRIMKRNQKKSINY